MSIIRPVIVSGSRAERILNSYLYSPNLRSLEQVIVPTCSAATLTSLQEDEVAYTGTLLYYLTVTVNAIQQLGACLTDACYELELFTAEFGADLEAYARYKYEEATQEAGRGRRKKLSHRVLQPVDLAPFQLSAVLSPLFAGHAGRKERIGTSGPRDYAYCSSLLSNDVVHQLRDPGRPAIPSNFTTSPRAQLPAFPPPAPKVDEADEVDPWVGYDVSMAEHGPAVVVAFDALLQECQQAAAHFRTLAPTDAAGYARLHEQLNIILDGNEPTEYL